MTIAEMLVILKERLSKFTCSVANEQLSPNDVAYARYNSATKNWIATPAPKVRVGSAGVETLIFPTAYTVDYTGGFITFSVARASTDLVYADYEKSPFIDSELTSMLESAVKQIRVLTFHAIESSDIPVNYSEAIIKKAIIIALREIQYPTTKYFAISIGGRSIDKSQQVTQIESLIASSETDLMKDINVIRYYDKTNILT